MLGLRLNYHPEVDCPDQLFLGTKYGGWWVLPSSISSSSIIYSFGAGNDISFDRAIIERYQAHVYAFDPTPNSINWLQSQKLPEHFHFFDFGLAHFDGVAKLYPNIKPDSKRNNHSLLIRRTGKTEGLEARFHRLKTIMNELGHERIDLLKMDIEGAEYEVIDDILSSQIRIDQILVEFHHNRFQNIGVSDTKKAIRRLQTNGFQLFNVSEKQTEFSFIRAKLCPSRSFDMELIPALHASK